MLDWRVSLKRREVQANTRDRSEEGLPGSHCVIVLGNRFVLLEMGWMFLGTFWLLGEASSFLGTLNWFLGTVRACPFKRYRTPPALTLCMLGRHCLPG